ncbi:MAG TPA: DUF302 domain-containing protein [Gammaproteobacteria bacterium]|nr:DUF302 domain-containing protein [Gammaproteobacteria bacterium]
MKRIFIVLVLTVFSGAVLAADNGLIRVKSAHSVSETLDRFEKAVSEKGMTVFTRIDHTAGATRVGKSLRPTQLLIFGNPKIGTLLMQSQQSAAIDLPLKALAIQDDKGDVWLLYNDPAWLAARHGITDRDPVVAKMTGAMKAFSKAATQK